MDRLLNDGPLGTDDQEDDLSLGLLELFGPYILYALKAHFISLLTVNLLQSNFEMLDRVYCY